MKNLLILLLVLVSLGSCKKDEVEDKEVLTTCGVENPLVDLQWLADIKFTFDVDQGAFINKITQYEYNDADVFLIEACYQCDDAGSYLANCDGDVICEFGTIAGINTCPDFATTATLVEVLYEN